MRVAKSFSMIPWLLAGALGACSEKPMPKWSPPSQTVAVKSIEEMRAEAIAHDKEVADARASQVEFERNWATEHGVVSDARRQELIQVYMRCGNALREKMGYLEADGDYVEQQGSTPAERVYRVKVRLSDSFRAAPVGVVECRMSDRYGQTTVTKVRM